VVREALMEPLRQCQLAKQFLPCVVEGQEKLRPCVAYPNCFRCPMELCGGGTQAQAPCTACGARRMSLYDVPSEQLLVPDVSADDFLHILTKVKGSVATEESPKGPRPRIFRKVQNARDSQRRAPSAHSLRPTRPVCSPHHRPPT
jgi:hypothetical protein